MAIWTDLVKGMPKIGGAQVGDHVLGHTPFKNPIYANRGADHSSYAGWNQADHAAAAKAHQQKATELHAASQRAGGSLTLKRQAMQHTHFAMTHRQATPGRLAASASPWVSLAKAAMTHYTKRGMPLHLVSEGGNQRLIEAAGHHGEHITPSLAIQARPHFSSDDHLDAADHHQAQAKLATTSADRHGHHILAQAHAYASMAAPIHAHGGPPARAPATRSARV